MDYVMIAIGIGIDGFLFSHHKRHNPIDYLEDDLHGHLTSICVFIVFVLILEGAVMDESLVIIALLRCATIVWLGAWLNHIGVTLYDWNQPRLDNILLQPDETQDMINLLTCIGYLVMCMLVVAIEVLAVYFFLYHRHQSVNNHVQCHKV